MDAESDAFSSNLTGSASAQPAAPKPSEDAVAFIEQTVMTVSGIPGVIGGGLMLLDEEYELRYAASTDGDIRQLERWQEEAGEGPCVQAYVVDAMVGTTDITTDGRWPTLAALVGESPIRAVLALPVHAGGGAIGTLNAYADRTQQWGDEQIQALTALAAAVSRLLTSNLARHRSDQLVQQLQLALEYRAGIERAVGFLMARHDLDAVAAFDRLRSAARSNRLRVADVARDLLEGRPLPALRHRSRPSRPN